MIATIIGAEGKMGKWLQNHLPSIGFSVISFDERRGDPPSVLAETDVVIVSVPVSATIEVIKRTQKHMQQGSILIEITSLKSGIYEEMVKMAREGLEVISLHPMFGPSVQDLTGKTIAIVPLKNLEQEREWAERLFPGTKIVELDPVEHDKLMTHILSVPYLVNMAIAATMKDMDLVLLKQLSGTSFALQYTLVQSVTGETTSLIHALLKENRFLEKTVRTLISNMEVLLNATSSKVEFEKLHQEIKEKMMEDPSHLEAPKFRQAAYNEVKPLLR
jgi:prephenate dehydrogenase